MPRARRNGFSRADDQHGMEAGRWSVLLHDDEINTFATVTYALGAVYGFPPDRGFAVATDLHDNGQIELTTLPSREQAEALVVACQVYGLHATVREA